MTNPFAKRTQPSGWVLPVSLTMLVVGFMASTAFIQSDKKDPSSVNTVPADEAAKRDLKIRSLENELQKVNERNSHLEGFLAKADGSSKEINKALQDARRIAAMTDVTGPGIQITLRDSKKGAELPPEAGIIHDTDVLKVVNELWNAGAEAISIDDRRVGPGTNIRCVGSTVMVDQQKIAAPITIRAIGSPKDLKGGLELPGGHLDEISQTDPDMVKIETMNKILLRAWTGSTTWQHATVPAEEPQQ